LGDEQEVARLGGTGAATDIGWLHASLSAPVWLGGNLMASGNNRLHLRRPARRAGEVGRIVGWCHPDAGL